MANLNSLLAANAAHEALCHVGMEYSVQVKYDGALGTRGGRGMRPHNRPDLWTICSIPETDDDGIVGGLSKVIFKAQLVPLDGPGNGDGAVFSYRGWWYEFCVRDVREPVSPENRLYRVVTSASSFVKKAAQLVQEE